MLNKRNVLENLNDEKEENVMRKVAARKAAAGGLVDAQIPTLPQ
jgi:hypothetical protein